MSNNLVITIGRSFGSGGREIGKKLAEELDMAYYDKEILEEVLGHLRTMRDTWKEVMEKNRIAKAN